MVEARGMYMMYRFQCSKCGSVFQVAIAMADYDNARNSVICPECKSKANRYFEAFEGGISLSNGMYGTSNGGWNV